MEKRKITRTKNFSWDPEDINDPKNAPYVCVGADGEKFIDWANPGHKLERWTDRINVLANGSLDEIMDVYAQEYYNRLSRKLNIGPEASDKKETANDKKVTPFPERKATVDADEALLMMRGMKTKIKKLMWKNSLLAMFAAKTGCPEKATPGCKMAEFPPEERANTYCIECWLKYADSVVNKPGYRQKNVTGIENA